MPTPDHLDAMGEFIRQLARYRDYWSELAPGAPGTDAAAVLPVCFQCLTNNGRDELVELVGLVTF